MKKARILAALLCVMMVVCSLPMLTLAALPTNIYNAAGEKMGANTAEAVVNDASYGGMKFDFTDSFTHTSDMSTEVYCSSNPQDYTTLGFSYHSTNGLSFPAGSASDSSKWHTWKYYPSAFSGGWSPLSLGAYTFRFKLDDDGVIETEAAAYSQNWRVFARFSTTKVTVWSSSGDVEGGTGNSIVTSAEYAPGSGVWNDVLIVADGGAQNSTGGYTVYAKKESDAQFTQIATTNGYRNGGAWKSTGVKFSGASCYVSDAVMLKTSAHGPMYDSIEDIMGAYATTYNFEFDENFASDMNTGTTADETYGGITHDGTYTANGWTGTSWYFKPVAGWRPVTDTTAFSIKVKGTIKLRGTGDASGYRLYVDLVGTTYRPSCNVSGTGTHLNSEYSSVTRTNKDWAEYLFAPNGTGYCVYLKSDSYTGGKWEKVVSTDSFNKNQNANGGISLTDGVADTTYIKSVKVYSTSAVANDTTLPETATDILYSDDFAAEPAYTNLYGSKSVTDGKHLSITNTADNATDGTVWLEKVEIPIGGYAEYKLRAGDTAPTVTICDGASYISILNRINYGGFGSGLNLFSSEGGNTYRTWRIVRTGTNTYNVYCKAEGDSYWYPAATNLTGTATSDSKYIKIAGSTSYAGADGVTKLDYLRVYGPALGNGTMILTDGYSTAVIEDDATLKFEDSLRAIVNAESGKLLVVTYKGNDMLKAEIVDVASMTDNSVIVDAKADGATKVTVYLWESFTSLNKIVDAVTLNL